MSKVLKKKPKAVKISDTKIPRGEIKRTRPLATAAAMGDLAGVKKLLAIRGEKAIPNEEIIEAYILVENFGHQGVKTLLGGHPAVRNIYGLVKEPKKPKSKKKKVRFIEIEEYHEPEESPAEKMSEFIRDLISETPLPKKTSKKTTKATKATKKVAKKTKERKRPSPLKDVGGMAVSAKEIKKNKEAFAKLRKEFKAKFEEENPSPVKNVSSYWFYKTAKKRELEKSKNNLSEKEIKKEIESTWKKMTQKEKKPYELQAQKDEKRYKKEKLAYDKAKKLSPVF